MAVFRYRASTAAHRFTGRFAGKALAAGYPGVAEWAQRHVMPTFVGCLGLVLTLAFGAVGATYGALTADAPAAARSGMGRNSAVFVSPPPAADPSGLAPGEKLHKIVRLDTVSTIARDYGVSSEALVARNAALLAQWQADCEEITTGDGSSCVRMIRRGKNIVIPAGGTPPASHAQ